jgi:hypothetical protein
MSDVGGTAPAAAGGGELSIAQAVTRLSTPPEERKEEPAAPEERPPPRGAPPPQSPDEGDDAEAEQPPGDEPEVEDEAEEPPVQPPRTWTKAEKEAFALLPREHQQSIVDRESERDSYYQRGLKEAAEKSRAAQAREQAAEQRQREYERLLPEAYAEKRGQFDREFADIKSQADVDAMRVNDPMRWMAFQDAKSAVWAKYNEAQTAGQRQMQEQSERYKAYQTTEAVKVEEYLAKAFKEEFKDWTADPELKTTTKIGEKVRQNLLEHLGFSEDEISSAWHNGQPLYLADSRIQQMALESFAWRRLQAQKAAAPDSRKPLPPVQRPGTATNRGEASNVQLKILNDKLTRSGRIEDAVALLNAKSARRR